MLPVESPFKTYTGTDGKPLDGGYVYFGQPNQNPITSPVTVYWDAAGTQPAAQPLRTVNGYIMRAGTPANVFFTGSYSELVQDSKKRQVFYARTSDDFSIATVVSNFLTNIASSIGSSLIGFIQSGTGAITRTAQSKLRETVSVLDFGAVGDGVTDCTAAFAAAVAAVMARNGGTVVVPEGRFLLNGSAGADGVKNGVLLPYTSYAGTDNRVVIAGSGRSTVLLAGSNNMIVVRMSNSYCNLMDLSIDGNGKTGVIGQALYPQDLTQTTTRTDQSYNYSRGIWIRNCTEGLVLRNGPKVGGLDGACWYNSFTDYHILDTLRGVWLRGPTGSGGSATPNRNKFTNIRIGSGGGLVNTGVQIDGGNTNVFVGIDCEGILYSTSPNAVPTAFKVVRNEPISGADNNNNRFFGCTVEACTRDFDNDNFYTELHGCTMTGAKMLLTTVPVIMLGGSFADMPQTLPGYSFQSGSWLPSVQPLTMQMPYGRMGFPATQNPSTDPNTLDDYEEGTFTPGLTASSAAGYAYTSQVGSYIKIGRMVFFEAYVELSGFTTAGGNFFRVTGLPFTSMSGTHKERPVSVNVGNLTGMVAGQYVTAAIFSGMTDVNLNFQDQNGEVGTAGLNGSKITTTTWVRVAGSYMTSN
jgi:hypothetical protein